MPAGDDVIASAVVRVGPDLTGFREKLIKDAEKATKGLSFKVKIVADGSGLKKSVALAVRAQMALANQPVYKVKVVADSRGLKKSIADVGGLVTGAARRTEEDVTRTQAAGLRARQQNEEGAARQRTRTIERAARDQQRTQQRAFKQLSSSPPLFDYGGRGIKPTNLLLGVVTAMTPALFAMSASAAQASTSIAALGSAGVGAALGLSGVAVAFQGIGDLLSLRKQVLNEQTTGAANAARDAVRSVDDLAQARRSLNDAQRDEATAEADLHKARRESIRDLEDLKQAVIDLDNQYKSDTLSVAEARQNAQATDRNFFASALEKARAWQDVRDAETRQKDTGLERKQKKQDLKESLAGGIDKSDRVQQARERVRDARDRRLDAQAAMRRQSSSTAAGVDKVSSAAAQLKQKIKELGPAAEDMFNWFLANEALFKRLHRQINNAVLPGFTRFLEAITEAPKGGKSTLELAAQYAGELGAIIGKYAGKFGEWTKSPLFRSSMARIQERNATAFDNLGKALLILADPIVRILDKASPGFVALSEIILKLSGRFADWIEQLDESGGLEKWFKDSRTELGKWWDIVSNIAELFKNIFTASLPAGSSLVTSFRDFTQSLVDWSNSPNGKTWLKDFFERVKNVPYAQIIDFFKNATTFFVAFRAFKLLSSLNPFMLAFGAFAASNPELAARAFATIAQSLGWAMEQIVAHPAAATTLLTMFAAAKLGKTIGFDIKIPVINSLRDAITSRFKVLDKFVGGGASTATMTVHAGVVNVYGKGGADLDLPGRRKPGLPPVVPGAPGLKPGKPGLLGRVGGPIAIALAAYELYFTEFGRQIQANTVAAVAGGISLVARQFTKEAIARRLKDPLGSLSADLGGMVAALLPRPEGEHDTFSALNRDSLAFEGPAGNTNIKSIVNRRPVQEYIAARKESVKAAVEEAKATGNAALAKKVEIVETRLSVDTLSKMLQQYGLTKDKADSYSRAVYDLNGLMYDFKRENQAAADALLANGNASETAGNQAGNAAKQFKDLHTEVKNVADQKKIILTVDGKSTVISDLEDVAAYQQAIRQGKLPTESFLREQKRLFAKNTDDPNLVDPRRERKARGGRVTGFSPHDTADNIPAWLTANEYVQPVAAVKHYGTDFMEAVRTRRFPRFAAGGTVNDWPFPVGIPKNAVSVVEEEPGIGAPFPEFTGSVPKGIGNLKGVVGPVAAATVGAKRLFPQLHVSSGLRKTYTRSRRKSNHWFGRAVDLVPPSMALFNYLKGIYGKTAREIIYTPAGKRQVYHGRDYFYRDPGIQSDHYSHVHLALAQGGLVPRKFDTGGVLPPGYSLAFNGTGQNETVRTARQEQQIQQGPMRLDRRDMALLANAVRATDPAVLNMDGRRVAEVTNRYNYLPSGV